MANKTQVATVGEQQAAIVINNQFIDGLTKQLEEKCKYGLSFPSCLSAIETDVIRVDLAFDKKEGCD